MFQLFKKAAKEQIAIDIGSQKTKILHIAKGGGKPAIDRAVIMPTPPGTFNGGEILHEDDLALFLTKRIGEWDMEGEPSVIAGISGKGVLTKQINIPKIESSLIAEHLPFEAEQYLPYDLDEVDLDYEILKGVGEGREQIPVLLVAALQKTVSSYNRLFEKAFVSCETLDASVFALFNSFERSHKLSESEVCLLADIGFNSSNIVIVLKNQVVFTRNIAAGGNLYTKEIQAKMRVGWMEAEELKISAGKGESRAKEVQSVIEGSHAALCDEIYSSYEIYLNFFANHGISKIYVTGGGSLIPGVNASLSKRFSVPVEAMRPFAALPLAGELASESGALAPFLTIAAGLGLRGLG